MDLNYVPNLLPYWRFIILLCLFAGGIHIGFMVHGCFHLLTPYPYKNASFILVRGQPGQDLGLFCYLLQLLAVVGLNVGAPLKLATPIQVAACLFPVLAVVSGVDAFLPIFKRGYEEVFYSKESDILARLAVAASLGFLSGISVWMDWALRGMEGHPTWGSMGQRDRTFVATPRERRGSTDSADSLAFTATPPPRLHFHRQRSASAQKLQKL